MINVGVLALNSHGTTVGTSYTTVSTRGGRVQVLFYSVKKKVNICKPDLSGQYFLVNMKLIRLFEKIYHV